MKKLPSVTIAVVAYNEERNIHKFLTSVIAQKEEGFVIDKILMYSDGSDDNTVSIAKNIKSKKIKIMKSKKRVGKSTWLNDIYTKLTSDFLVQSDADVVFAHPYVVRDMVKPLIKNPTVGMCGGNPTPLPGSSFWERAVWVAFTPYQDFRSKVRGGNNAFSAVGQILAYRKTLLKSITVPKNMVTNDLYTYFCCLSLQWRYRYVKSAVVLFQPPSRLRDIVRQNTRFQTGHLRMFDYFEKQLVNKEMHIPLDIKYLSLLKHFLKHPLLSLVYYSINIYAKLHATLRGGKLDAKWQIATTTKELQGVNL